MAMVNAENVAVQASGFGALPLVKQMGLLLGLALSVALGVTVAIWSQSPNYSMLYANLPSGEMLKATQALDKAGIEYQIEQGGTAVMVPAAKVHEARIKLATLGLSAGGSQGMELLEKEQGFGTSSFMQKARYHHALEGELARSIAELDAVESARVHLAMPKQSVFAREATKPAVSVILNLYAGRTLDEMQTAGIVNMVASSIPGLDLDNVTVIDQRGRLLSSGNNSREMMLSSSQFDYTRNLEERYVKRILDIIGPIVGLDGVRAQVVADVDFTALEQTRESYLPEQMALRSEQVFEDSNADSMSAGGVPGALSNQPPTGGVNEINTAEGATSSSGRSTSRAIRNYELDRTISHTRQAPASLKRISVGVVVDYRNSRDEKGNIKKEALDEQEMQRITELVKRSVGLDETRGDTLHVVNTPFQQPELIGEMPEVPIWQQAWVMDLARQLLGGLVVLIIAFGVLRPMLRNLSQHGKETRTIQGVLENQQEGQVEGLPQPGTPALGNSHTMNDQQLLEVAGSMVQQDPKRVAQVMTTWVGDE